MNRTQAMQLWHQVSKGAPDGVATGRSLEAFANAVEGNVRADLLPTIDSLRQDKEALCQFSGMAQGSRAVGLSDAQVRHLRWAIAKGLCTIGSASDVLRIAPDSLRSVLGA